VTAAAGAALGWKVILVLNGQAPAHPTGNLRYDYLFGADVRFVARREDRDASMDEVAEQMHRAGRRPFIIPTGGSTPTGAIGMARGVSELGAEGVRPDVIVHATSSGGTQAGLIAGCALFGLSARVMGISVDDPAEVVADRVGHLIDRMSSRLGGRPETLRGTWPIEVDASQVGGGYSVATEASREARTLMARTEGIVLDSTYTAKAMAAVMARVRDGGFQPSQTVLFWHTGGLSE
jgi:D-cysteine desulfhydrase